MTNLELQAIRRSLHLSAAEISQHITGKTRRHYQYCEAGTNSIPLYLERAMRDLVVRRDQIVAELNRRRGKVIEVRYYPKPGDWFADNPDSNHVDWRVYQSAVAVFYLENYAAGKCNIKLSA